MKRWIFLLVALALFACPAHGQFIGYQSPQTVIQKVFSAQTTAAASPAFAPTPPSLTVCTPTPGSPCGVQNLGQSIHAVNYTVSSPCVGAFGLDLRLEASNDGVSWFAISEDAVDQPNGALQGSTFSGGITAIGAYAAFRVNLVKLSCGSGTPAVTAFYSGTSTSTPTPAGLFIQALPYRKLLVENVDTTTASTSLTVPLATGNASGNIYVQCQVPATGAPVACPSGGGISVTAAIADSGNIAVALVSPVIAATSSLQTFVIPPFLTNRLSITVNPTGGPSGTNWTMYYQASSQPGSGTTGTAAPQVQTTGADPCQSTSVIKAIAFANITTATTTSLVGVNGTKAIYVCQIVAQLNSSTASTVLFEYGTGAACSSPIVLTATYTNSTLVSEVVTIGGGASAIMSTPGAEGLCAVTTVGTSPTIPVTVSYVQQ